jgi:hypothetical protein
MSYIKTKTDKGSLFNITPEEAPSLLKAILFPVMIPLAILLFINVYIFLLMLLGLGAWIYVSQNSKNVTQYRTPTAFTVNENGVLFGNTMYAKEDIHRLIIRNHVNEQYVFVPGKETYHRPEDVRAGLKLRQQLINVSYRVDMEVNGKPLTLAGGITEPAAFAILSETAKIMNYAIR